jgi:hypothetical protein
VNHANSIGLFGARGAADAAPWGQSTVMTIPPPCEGGFE